MASSEAFIIREATLADCPQISGLIEELNKYEELPNSPHVNARALEEHGFGENPIFKCFVALDTCDRTRSSESIKEDTSDVGKADVLIGYVLFCYGSDREGQHTYMEDLYVTPAHRSKGIGNELWRTILKLGLEAGALSCRFCVLDWNAPSIAFYKSKGAQDVTTTKGFHFFGMTKDLVQKFVDRRAPIQTVAAIRPAKETDLDEVLAMQHHLDVRLGDPSKRLTREELQEAIFSSFPSSQIVVAENNVGSLLGYALFSVCFTTWEGRCSEVSEVYVKPDSRRKGVAFTLLQHVMKHCLSLGCMRCDFLCAADSVLSSIFEKMNTVDLTTDEGWHLMVMEKEAMIEMVNGDRREPS